MILVSDGLLPGEKLRRVGSIAKQHLTRGYHRKPANRELYRYYYLDPISNALYHSDHILETRNSLLLSLSPSYSPACHRSTRPRRKVSKAQNRKPQ